MGDFSKHQQTIIKRYYENLDAITLQKLGEMVTELYLAEGKRRQQQWKRIVTALEKLKVPQSRIDNLVKPLILREAANIHPMLGFLAIIGGLISFGPLGLLVGPVILSLVLSAIRIYRLDILGTRTSASGAFPPAA